MFHFGQRQTLVISIFIMLVTACLLVWRPDYNFFDGGLITAILLTIFIKKDAPTRFMGIACTILVVVIACLPHKNPNLSEVFIEHFFSLILVISSTLLVLFLKRLYRTMQELNQALEKEVEKRTANLELALSHLASSQAELKEALEKEKELSEIKSRFVSMASHEFRTPLSAILSSAALIGKYPSSDDQPRREKHVQKIRDSVIHLNELLEDFLSLGRIEEGKIHVHPENISMYNFSHETAEEVQGLLKPGQVLDADVQADLNVVSDKRLLKHIFVNLLTNASKFSPAGTAIHWKLWEENGQIHAIVQDHGMGIPEEDKAYLFSSFFRGRNVTNIQGTGLGLHIVKRYVDMLHGHISVESELNKGTKIIINFPNQQTI
ncbi:sensor histidine kinase [Chitinophaga sp. GCM10012297]|uniref:histidine kinase n=1 Tax=Chitinophaga chungangae TaxID=2821488 RepID=A0ABS3YJI6_9BACT|nr:HAMP domain-containing sensor histidine kinase [Chitinophaga chungangae]MBO9154851.1 HAMP domain-containing histidine kinase [Chitinophaga chungangae]